MQYNAHRPFATGFMTGNFTQGITEGTRFASDFALNSVFRKEYDNQALHGAMKELTEALQPHGILPHEASIRWLAYHSQLRPADGIIFGASKLSQIQQNLAAIQAGPLPEEVVTRMDRLWETVAPIREEVL